MARLEAFSPRELIFMSDLVGLPRKDLFGITSLPQQVSFHQNAESRRHLSQQIQQQLQIVFNPSLEDGSWEGFKCDLAVGFVSANLKCFSRLVSFVLFCEKRM